MAQSERDDTHAAISIDGATRLLVIIGDPIAQVKSPAGMSRALARAGRNAVLVPVEIGGTDLDALLEGLAGVRNLDGIVVTVPHKLACFGSCRTVSERAKLLSAVNVMRRGPGGGWHGDALDGLGFLAAARSHGARPEGARALLIGAGGAGSAIALALVEAGVRELLVHDADVARRDRLIGLLAGRGRCPVRVGSPDPTGCDLVVNATPAGMRADDALPIEVERLSPSAFVGCVVTAPPVPPLIAAARARGCPTSTGSDMYKGVEALMLAFFAGADVP